MHQASTLAGRAKVGDDTAQAGQILPLPKVDNLDHNFAGTGMPRCSGYDGVFVSALAMEFATAETSSAVGALQLKNIRGSRSFSDSGKDRQ